MTLDYPHTTGVYGQGEEHRGPRRPGRQPQTHTIVAYAVRWDVPSHGAVDVDGTPADVVHRIRPGALDDWLRRWRDGETDAPTVADHKHTIGRFTDLDADHIGLRTTAAYDNSDAARRMLADIDDGTVTAYSIRLAATDVEPTDETHNGLPVVDVLAADLVEAGPGRRVADPGAVIVEVDRRVLRTAWPAPPAGDFLEHLTGLTGITRDHVDRERRARRENVRQAADDIERLARGLAAARRAADSAYRNSRSPWAKPSDYPEYLDAQRDADLLDDALRDAILHDPQLYRDLSARFRIPPKVSITSRMLTAAGATRRRAA
jgi:prohead serine protease